MTPTLGTSTLLASVMSLEMLCAWLLRLASSRASAPGVSMKVTMGTRCLAEPSRKRAASR